MNENLDFNNVKNSSDTTDILMMADLKVRLKEILLDEFCSELLIEEKNNTVSIVAHNQIPYLFIIMSPTEILVKTSQWMIRMPKNLLTFISENSIHFTFQNIRKDTDVLVTISFVNHPVNDYLHFVPLNKSLLDKLTFIDYDRYSILYTVFSNLDEYLYLTMTFESTMSKHELSVYGDDIKILNDKKTDVVTYIDNRKSYKDPSNYVIQVNSPTQYKIYNKIEESFNFNDIQISDSLTHLSGAILDNCMNVDDLPDDKKTTNFIIDVEHKFKQVFDKWNDNKKTKWEYKPPKLNWIQIWNEDESKPYSLIMLDSKKHTIKQITFQSDNFPIYWFQSVCFFKYEFMRLLYNNLNEYFYYTHIITSNYQLHTIDVKPYIIGIDFEGVTDLSNIDKIMKFLHNAIPILGYSKFRVDIKNADNMNDEQLHSICDELTNYWVRVNVSGIQNTELERKVGILCSKLNPSIGVYGDDEGLNFLFAKNIKTVNKKFNDVLKKNNIKLEDIQFICDCPKFSMLKRTTGWDDSEYVVEFKYFFIYKEKSCTISFLKIVDLTNIKQINAARWNDIVNIYQ